MTPDELPAPLVPSEVDLRDFASMWLDVRRLLSSDTWIAGADAPKLAHASMSLWCEAWHQVPAGSLPDNDALLARFAMCAPRQWKQLRPSILHGWVKCSDGRLYHPVVAEKALEAWAHKMSGKDGRDAHREKMRGWREAKKAKAERSRDGHVTITRGQCDDHVTITEASQVTITGASRDGSVTSLTGPDGTGPEDSSLRSESTRARLGAIASKMGFDRFWHAYPEQVGIGAARQAWPLAVAKASIDEICDGVERYRQTKPPDQRWCHPATYLNEERWHDAPDPTHGIANGGGGYDRKSSGPASGPATVLMRAAGRALAKLDQQEADRGAGDGAPEPLLDRGRT